MVEQKRVVIIGNSGSGKTHLSKELSRIHELPIIHLDDIHWEPNEYGVRRDREAARQAVAQEAEAEQWIMEGVFGWLAEVALPRATHLIWLDVSTEECLSNVQQRGKHQNSSDDDFSDFLDWIADYNERKTSSSYAGHLALFDGYSHDKTRLHSRDEIASFLARV